MAHLLDQTRQDEEWIDAAIKVYLKNTPEIETTTFFLHMERLRSNLRTTKGFTENKHFLWNSEIPKKLYLMLNPVFGTEWRNNKKILRMFLDRARKCRINENSLPATLPEKFEDQAENEEI